MQNDSNEMQLIGGRTKVTRKGNCVIRQTGPWAPSVHALLRHLEAEGFSAAPRVVDDGFDAQGHEVLTYIEGDTTIHPKPWRDEAIVAVGLLLKTLHAATANFTPPKNAIWRPWFGRELDYSSKVIGHCDFAPWNLVSHDGIPFAAIDWEAAGPVDRLVELAQVCWLNVQLCDEKVAERVGLPPVEARAKQLRLLVDAYELPSPERRKLMEVMIKFALLDAADNDDEWAIEWRARAAIWMIENRKLLDSVLA
jgi:hypothetical protein